jgi:hypothetical protein
MIFRLVIATFLFLYVTALTSEELGWAEVASELKDWVESIPKVSSPVSGSPLKSDGKNSEVELFDSFILKYSVDPSAKDCSGKRNNFFSTIMQLFNFHFCSCFPSRQPIELLHGTKG